jgi:hypothetical protein
LNARTEVGATRSATNAVTHATVTRRERMVMVFKDETTEQCLM